jgi:hypothetical protein
MEKHCIFFCIPNANSIIAPEVVKVIQPILKDLDGWEIENRLNKFPGAKFFIEGAPIRVAWFAGVPEWDDESERRIGAEPDAGYLDSGGFDVWGNISGIFQVLPKEGPAVGEAGFDPDISSWAADFGEFGFSSGFGEVKDGDCFEIGLSEDGRWMIAWKDFVFTIRRESDSPSSLRDT